MFSTHFPTGNKMMFLVLCIGLSTTGVCVASTQTPTLTSCSTGQSVQLSNVAITNAELGKTMTVNFTLGIGTTLNSNPQLKLTMTKNNGQAIICVAGIGSCFNHTLKPAISLLSQCDCVSANPSNCLLHFSTYNLCGGTSDAEGLGSLWNNTCPILPNTYVESLAADLPTGIGFLLGNGVIDFKMDIKNGGQSVGCQQFKVTIKLR